LGSKMGITNMWSFVKYSKDLLKPQEIKTLATV
jgi:hypothetical protein